MQTYSAQERTRARRPIASLIRKSEKALQKLTPGTWQHTMLTDNLEALHMGAALLNKDGGVAVPLPQEDMASNLRALACMIARTQDAQPRFAPGTVQHTLLHNRLFALQVAQSLIHREMKGDPPDVDMS